MNKFKKIVCCAIMPIVAMVGLAGCGNDRDSLTIQNRYTQMTQDHSDMFLRENDDTISVKFGVTYHSGEMTKLENLEDKMSSFSTDPNLYVRYHALKNLQATVLDNVFDYFKQQKDKFFTNFDAQEMDKKERKQLYNNIEDLEEAVETFKVARDKFENSVDVLTFEGIVRVDITSYAYDYNMLIEKCIEFVRYFKELNIKYYYSGEVNDINYQEYIKQYLDEAIFEVNEVLYYNYIKSCNSVAECDLANAFVLTDNNSDGTYDTCSFSYDAVLSNDWLSKLAVLENLVDAFDSDNYIYGKITLDSIANFQQEREMFLQKFNVYKTVYEKMDYYKYHQAVQESLVDDEVRTSEKDALVKYKKECTNVENANINLVESFYKQATHYIIAIKGLVA